MKDKKKIVIGALCALIMIMAVGYALLSQQLTINGAATIDSTWKVEITDIKEVENIGSGRTISTDYTATTATFSTGVVHTGDKITYEITVTNKGTLDAVLESYTVDIEENDSIIVTTDKDFEYYKGMKLAKNGGTNKITITVQYNPNVTSQPTDSTSSVHLTLNYEQDLGQVVGYTPYRVGDKISFAGSDWYVIKKSLGDEDYVTVIKEKVLTAEEIGNNYSTKFECREWSVNSNYNGCTELGPLALNKMGFYWNNKCYEDTTYGTEYLVTNTITGYEATGCSGHNNYEESKIKEMLENSYLPTVDSDGTKLKEVDGYKIRLIKYEELVNDLGYDPNYNSAGLGTSLYATENVPTWVYQNFDSNDYWTMSAKESSTEIWYIRTKHETGHDGVIQESYIYRSSSVRPVINILKSAIDN